MKKKGEKEVRKKKGKRNGEIEVKNKNNMLSRWDLNPVHSYQR